MIRTVERTSKAAKVMQLLASGFAVLGLIVMRTDNHDAKGFALGSLGFGALLWILAKIGEWSHDG